jgi:hypothetical protein
MLDWHYFQTAVEYAGLDGNSKDVGMEFDLTVKTTSVDGLGLIWGLSYFLPKDNFAEMTENDPGFWGTVRGQSRSKLFVS